ncbi:MAG: zinc ribbon domain-containing protein [SAR202 cluster bacterium]|nr:zinc ribbon domain-containing protein [SAR202 cluster bacterium]MDP7102755.1 zinc ribbon domain-containing protein [SAR202 cluster bacterium]MDP7224236.1 zinc ribbon domain-containing protein [SAR202 cluster bacterium]MDP7533982.1 zinc ribbon domain-containing protein [SAR202 cluster bacterium]
MTIPDMSVCQSCAMTLAKPEDHGTNADGSAHDEYCTYCYQQSAFVAPDQTMESMADFISNMIPADAIPTGSDAAATARQTLAGLKRWQ